MYFFTRFEKIMNLVAIDNYGWNDTALNNRDKTRMLKYNKIATELIDFVINIFY